MSAIKIENFTKKYGDFTAVKELNLEIPTGTIVGFVGKNGAGKSTTLRSLLDMIHPTTGKMTILGLDSQTDTKEIKRKVSYVPSESAFYENVTVLQLLKFAIQFMESDVSRIEELAEYFELDLSKKIMELSLGNRKKVSLIQGFLKNSELIILDEPTSGLDPLMQNKFFEFLLREKKDGKTIFLSSHNLSEVERYCDKVAIIKDGELVDYFDMKDVKIKQRQVVTYQEKSGSEESFEVDGDINEVVARLHKMDLVSLEIRTKTVEDEFIEYYKEEE